MEWQAIPGRQLESEVTLLSQGSLIKGDLTFDQMTRLHGRVEGKVRGLAGSVIVVGETGSVHGEIMGDAVIIDGFVHGNVTAQTKVTISESGRLIGNIQADQSISFQAMRLKLADFVEIIQADPAIDAVTGFTGGGQRNGGFMFISLKPLAERKISADQVVARLRGKLSQVPGANLFLVPVQDIRVGGRQSNGVMIGGIAKKHHAALVVGNTCQHSAILTGSTEKHRAFATFATCV